MNQSLLATLAIGAAFTLGGCGGSPAGEASSPDAASRSSEAWLLDAEPAGAVDVREAKSSAQEGDEIVLVGRIGGRKEPMSEGSPVFLLIDLEIPHCGQLEGDACKTPWDYCCEPRDSLVANSATVQLIEADGASSSADLSAAGLAPLDEVVVVGTVAPRPSEDVMLVRATSIYRRDG